MFVCVTFAEICVAHQFLILSNFRGFTDIQYTKLWDGGGMMVGGEAGSVKIF